MNPARLALRTLLRGHARARVALLIVAAAVCAFVLATANDHAGDARRRHGAIVEAGLGDLAILPPAPANQFDDTAASAIRRGAAELAGVTKVQPVTTKGHVARFAVYLDTHTTPMALEAPRAALAALLAHQGLHASVRTWMELTPMYGQARALATQAHAWTGYLVLVIVACVAAAGTALQAQARRRELASLRALGMRRSAIVLLLELEALWITLGGALLGAGKAALLAWLSHYLAGVWGTSPEEGAWLLLQVDAGSMLLGSGALLAVSVLAALPPALAVARHDVALGLALIPARQDG